MGELSVEIMESNMGQKGIEDRRGGMDGGKAVGLMGWRAQK